MKRTSKTITDSKEIEYLIGLTEDDIDTRCIMDLFGDFGKGPKYNPYDVVEIPAGSYGFGNKKNKNKFTTTIGRFIFNKYFIEADEYIFDALKYVNKTINKGTFEDIQDKLGYLNLEGKIPLESYKKFLMKTQKCMAYVSVLAPNHSEDMLFITEKLNKKKAELLKTHKEELDKGDLHATMVLDEITKELLDYAKEILKDDSSMDMFNSGAGGSFNNNFKNMFVMRGAVKDPDPRKGYNIITSNYVDGITKEDYPKLCNTLTAGPYARSKKTEVGGYWEKLFLAAFQHITLDPKGSDCGTSRYITVDVTKKNIEMIMYCYVIGNGGKLTLITSENKDSFIGKRIKIRFASMCESKTGICNKCAGDLFYMLGITNIGVATPQIPSTIKLKSMKLFHDDQMNFTDMDVMKAFCPDD